MRRFAFFLLGGCLAGVAMVRADPPPPNVIFILADDLGAETLGAYGGTSQPTPRLDAFAAQGARFTQAHAQPLCTPTRVQVMTGWHNVRNYQSFGRLEPTQRTFAHLFREAGYRTFVAGKWQLSDNVPGCFQEPLDFGFDGYFLWQLDRRPQRYFAPGFEAYVPEAGWFGQRVDYPAAPGHFGPDLVLGQVEAFLEHNVDHPFFLYYPMMLPHDPFVPPPGHPAHDPYATVEANQPAYYPAMVTYMDGQVGRLLDKLDALGLATNTLVVFLGDNGSPQQTASVRDGQLLVGGKALPTDAGTQVPLLVRWPGRVPAGRVVSDLVSSVDFLPTLAAACGLPVPADTDGQSFLPSLLDQPGPRRDWIYFWHDPRNELGSPFHEFVRGERYKLYRDGRFFDVLADRRELFPLDRQALEADARAAHAVLAAALDRYAPDHADRSLPPRVPDRVWAEPPAAGAVPGVYTLRAAEARDRNGPVRYQFRDFASGWQSDWQISPAHTGAVVGAAATLFHYRTRDILGNTSGWVTTGMADNPREIVAQQEGFDGVTGLLNLGQSFLVPAAMDGWLLDEITFYSAGLAAAAGSHHLALYDGFTNHLARGRVLAVSQDAVPASTETSRPLTWRFRNLRLSGGQTCFAAASDAQGLPLPSGQGLLVQLANGNPYPGGNRLNESGLTAGVDLRFFVTAYRLPLSFAEWRLLHPEAGDFAETASGEDMPNGLRFFAGGPDQGGRPMGFTDGALGFRISPGGGSLAWRIRHAPDLATPLADWQSLAPPSPLLEWDMDSREVRITPPDFSESLFLRLEVDAPAP
jgi:arylsulfatase A